MTNDGLKKSVRQRLGMIKGHIAGIEKMVDDNKSCEEILLQLSAISGAANKLSAHILENYMEACLKQATIDNEAGRQQIEKLTKMMLGMLKK